MYNKEKVNIKPESDESSKVIKYLITPSDGKFIFIKRLKGIIDSDSTLLSLFIQPENIVYYNNSDDKCTSLEFWFESEINTTLFTNQGFKIKYVS